MAKVLTENQIREWIQNSTYIRDGDVLCAEGIKYDFRIGSSFLKAYFGRVIDYNKDLRNAEEVRKAVVEPGEVVFVLSQEKLILPSNIYAILSPKRSLSQDGIELMGGLTIDPGYEGYLVFGLRNVAGTPYTITPGTKIVAANFFELSEDELVSDYSRPHSIETFPDKLLMLIEKYKPVNPQNLDIELKNLQKAFDENQDKIGTAVQDLSDDISQIYNDLTKESTKRELESKNVTDKFSSVDAQLRELDGKITKTDLKLDNMQKEITDMNAMVKETHDEIIKTHILSDIKGKASTAVITFIITVVAGVIVAFLQGWIG